jgi:hypothetical protein
VTPPGDGGPELGAVWLATDAPAETSRFLREVVGVADWDADPGEGLSPGTDWIGHDAGTAKLELLTPAAFATLGGSAGTRLLAFEVASLPAAIEAAGRAGTELGPAVTAPWGRYVVTRAPGDVHVQLYERFRR